MSILFLSVVPLLADPLSGVLPKYKSRGREGQRDLALVLNLISYAGAALYGFAAGVSRGLLFTFLAYLLSVLVLILFNKVIGIRASDDRVTQSPAPPPKQQDHAPPKGGAWSCCCA